MNEWCDVRGRFGAAVEGYFDTPSMGAPTVATVDTMCTALDDWLTGRARFEHWEAAMDRCRQSWARLSGVDERLVGTTASIVPAVSAVAQACARMPGDLLVHADEFRSLALPAVAAFGADRVRTISGKYESDAFVETIDRGVGLVILSSVSSATGARTDLQRIVDAADQAGAVVAVDSTQSEGILGLGLPTERLQAVFAAGYKGLLGPRGTGYSYIREDLELEPLNVASPYGMADGHLRGSYGAPGKPFPGGRGITQSPAWFSWVGAEPGLEILEEITLVDRESHALGRAEQLRAGLEELGLSVEASEQPSHITSISVADSDRACRTLESLGIRTASRLGRLRLGTHIYTNYSDVERALSALHDIDSQHTERNMS